MQPQNSKVPYGYGSIPPRPTRDTESERKQFMLEQAVLIQARSIDELAISIAALQIQIVELVRLTGLFDDNPGNGMEANRNTCRRQPRTRRICTKIDAPRARVCQMPMPPPVWDPDYYKRRSEGGYGVTVGVFAPISLGLLWLAFIALGRGSYLVAFGIGLTGAAMLVAASFHRWYALMLLGVPAVSLILAALVCWDDAKPFAALSGALGLALGFGAFRASAQTGSCEP